jgi:hypothetical protein
MEKMGKNSKRDMNKIQFKFNYNRKKKLFTLLPSVYFTPALRKVYIRKVIVIWNLESLTNAKMDELEVFCKEIKIPFQLIYFEAKSFEIIANFS